MTEIPGELETSVLVERAIDRDHAAYGRLYRLHHRRVYAAALRMVRQPELAEDVTQDSFLTAWTTLPSLRERDRFGSWICGIAVRTALHVLRGEERRRKRLDRYGRESYEAALVRSMPDVRIDIERVIASLPDRARAALVLHVGGADHATIAQEMGISIGTVKSQLHRARRLVLEGLNS